MTTGNWTRIEGYEFVEIEVDREAGVGWMRLNRPDKLNAFHIAMYEEIASGMVALDKHPDVRAILISGNGRAFCTGRDFKFSAELQSQGDPSAWRKAFRTFFPYTTQLSTPTVSAVHGYALGGGSSLALGADITLASPSAICGDPETRHGIASKSMLWAWSLGAKLSKEVVATGRLIKAVDVEHLKLVSAIVPEDRLLEEGVAVARELAAMPFGVTQTVRRMVDWVGRDMVRVSTHDRLFDHQTASYDAAGIEPSPWLIGLREQAEKKWNSGGIEKEIEHE